MGSKLEEDIKKSASWILEQGCILCGRKPADTLGIFNPNDPQKWGAAVGKSRIILYGICLAHGSSPEVASQAEEAILQRMKTERIQ